MSDAPPPQLWLCKSFSFYGLLGATCSAFLFSVDLTVYNGSQWCAEARASAPQSKKAAVCLVGDISTLGKLHPGVSYDAIDHELGVNDRQYILRSIFERQHI